MGSWDRVVCNTGPVVGLHLIGRLELLTQLIPQIVVPAVVVGELRAGMGMQKGSNPNVCGALIKLVSICQTEEQPKDTRF